MSTTSEFADLVRASMRGASLVFEGTYGLKLSRLPEWTYQQHAHAPIVSKMVERLSGTHLNLITSANLLSVRYRSIRDANLADGYLAGPSTIAVTAAGFEQSISHCEDADGPLGVWPVAAARELGLEIYNLGMGGCANLEQFSARTIRDIPADLISLKLGINVVNTANHTSRTFGPAVHGFIDTIREGQPTTPILVISPVCCPAHENNPGPSETTPEGMVKGQEFSRHFWIGELTLCGIREILRELVALRANSDPNIFYLDGLRLFGHADAPTMPDGIHPDAAGYRVIAKNFVAEHPREWIAALRS